MHSSSRAGTAGLANAPEATPSGNPTGHHKTDPDSHRAASRTVLWVSAHPEPESLTGSLRRDGITSLRAQGHRVITSDLYAMAWDPVVRTGNLDRHEPTGRTHVTERGRNAFLAGTLPDDVAAEHAKLRRADAVIVQYPLWWYGMPAILKGWFDRVFVSGFAFGKDPATGRRMRFEQGPFRGVRALAVLTLGDRPASIGPSG